MSVLCILLLVIFALIGFAYRAWLGLAVGLLIGLLVCLLIGGISGAAL